MAKAGFFLKLLTISAFVKKQKQLDVNKKSAPKAMYVTFLKQKFPSSRKKLLTLHVFY